MKKLGATLLGLRGRGHAFDPKIYLNESTLTFDGHQRTDWCEFGWNRDYFDFAKTYVQHCG